MKTLHDYTREQLENYMTDCHGFDAEQLAEWKTKSGLIWDIKSFKWEPEALRYLGGEQAMQKYAMKITGNDGDNTQHRIIIEVNGMELDILADNDGIVFTLQEQNGQKVIKEFSHDWE